MHQPAWVRERLHTHSAMNKLLPSSKTPTLPKAQPLMTQAPHHDRGSRSASTLILYPNPKPIPNAHPNSQFMVRGNPRRGTPGPALEVAAGTIVCAMRGWASDGPEADDAACLADGFSALRLHCDRLLLRGGQVGWLVCVDPSSPRALSAGVTFLIFTHALPFVGV